MKKALKRYRVWVTRSESAVIEVNAGWLTKAIGLAVYKAKNGYVTDWKTSDEYFAVDRYEEVTAK